MNLQHLNLDLFDIPENTESQRAVSLITVRTQKLINDNLAGKLN